MIALKFQQAAEILVQRRLRNEIGDRLPVELRPQSNEQALKIQRVQMEHMTRNHLDTVGGWKCCLPFDGNYVVAPLFSRTIHHHSPCPIQLDQGVCKIEPEIAFRFKDSLPSGRKAYSEQEVMDALEGAYMALELIQDRYHSYEEVPFLEHLADNLLNQGVFIGPELPLKKVLKASKIKFNITLDDSVQSDIKGKHPNQLPQTPLLWLVNYLNRSGQGIQAGQEVITGSYAGVLTVKEKEDFTIEYKGLGSMTLRFNE